MGLQAELVGKVAGMTSVSPRGRAGVESLAALVSSF